MSGYLRQMKIAWIIETIQIYGFINREHIERKFGVSTPQASNDLRDAIQSDPLITYDTSAKRYVYNKKGIPMTTTVKVHVNGSYRATIAQMDGDGTQHPVVFIDGDTPGSNERSFSLPHPAHAVFTVIEEPLTDEMKAERALSL